MKSNTAAVILAAGKGVRMVSRKAKVLHPLCGKPLLAHVLRTVERCGPDRTLVVVGHQADAVMAAFSDRSLEFVIQAEQRGTGHALMQAEKHLRNYRGEVLVLPGDTPLLTPRALHNLLRKHREEGAQVALLTTRLPEPSGYGRIVRHHDGTVAKIVEEADASARQTAIGEINAGIYCFTPSFLFSALEEIEDDNAQGELYLTDVIEVAARRSAKVVTLEVEAGEVLGVNSRVELAQAEKILRGRINREWMLRGVTIIDPEATYIDCDVLIGEDTVIHPGCHISGRTAIGEHGTILPGAVVIDSRIGRNARLGPYCVLEGASVPDGVEVAAFEVRKGNFRQ